VRRADDPVASISGSVKGLLYLLCTVADNRSVHGFNKHVRYAPMNLSLIGGLTG